MLALQDSYAQTGTFTINHIRIMFLETTNGGADLLLQVHRHMTEMVVVGALQGRRAAFLGGGSGERTDAGRL